MYSTSQKNSDEESEDSPRRFSRFLSIRTLFITLLVVVISLVAYFGFYAASAYRNIVVEGSFFDSFCVFRCNSEDKILKDPNPIPTPNPNYLSILLLGIRGEDDIANGGLLTDTMVLVTVDKTTKKAVMISFPRDLYIDLDATLSNGNVIHLKGKINEIYPHGLANNQGLSLTSQVISRISGIPIERAIVFDFNAFANVINTLGGIDIFLQRPFTEKTQWGYEFTLPAGENHLNSEQALYYVRSRYSSSDFDRARRQQQVLVAIKDKATSLGFWTNPRKISEVLDSLKGNIRTNFQPWEIDDILILGQSLKDGESIDHALLSPDNLLYESRGEKNEYILLPRNDSFDLLRSFTSTIFENPVPPTPIPTPKVSTTPSI